MFWKVGFMILCGVEEPIRQNPFLDEPDSGSRAVHTNEIIEPRLHRYTFIAAAPMPAARTRLVAHLRHMLVLHTLTATWCMLRRLFTGPNDRIRSLSWLARRRKASWQIYQDATLAIALKPTDRITNAFRPIDYVAGQADEACFLFLGTAPSLTSIAEGTLRDSLEHFSRSERWIIAPSGLKWLADQNCSLAYMVTDHLGVHWMLVIISPIQLAYAATTGPEAVIPKIDAWSALYM